MHQRMLHNGFQYSGYQRLELSQGRFGHIWFREWMLDVLIGHVEKCYFN